MSLNKNQNIGKGALCIIASAFFFALMGLFVQLAGNLPPIQKSFFRNAVAAIIAFVLLLKDGGGFLWKKGSLPALLARSVFGTVGVLCNFYALDHLILSDALILNKLSPFFAILLSFFILHEKITPFKLFMVFVAFLGSLFVIKPTPELWNPASVVGLLGGLGAGIAYTMVRKLSEIGERKTYIVFFFSFFSCLVLLPYIILNYAEMSVLQFVYLVLAGISAALGQFAITAAYSYAPAREISIYDYTQIIFSTLLSYFVFGNVPDALSVTGYVIICLSILIIFLKDKKASNK